MTQPPHVPPSDGPAPVRLPASRAARTSTPEPPTGGSTPPTRRRTVPLVIAVVALALGSGIVGGLTGATVAHRQDGAPADPTVSDRVAVIAQDALPSVVTIQISGSDGRQVGTGSGFVIRADGYIVTNNHVAAAGGDGEALTVVFADGSKQRAKVVGTDESYDLAVIKVARKHLPTLSFGDSDALEVGQPVIAVGAPLGLTGSVTTGIVSALDRPVTTGKSINDLSYLNAVQTDAPINPGNSGGPLLALTGKVIGVNSAIYTTGGSSGGEGGNIGLGFAIPSDQVRRTTDQLIKTGHADHPVIGVAVDTAYEGPGVRVRSVTDGGPADKAGIREGDVITQIDGRKVMSAESFIVALRSKSPGDFVTLVIDSGGEHRSVTVHTEASSGS